VRSWDRSKVFQIITFYEFKDLRAVGELPAIRESLRSLMSELELCGTIILSDEGFNSTLGGRPANVADFIERAGRLLQTRLVCKSSFHDELPFQRIKVKIKPEIVTLRKPVRMKDAEGTHVDAAEWNRIISDPDVVLLDTRNDYEYRTGTFRDAINPATIQFNELPDFIEQNLDPERHKKVAMFCTGGIRCEKFAPYMKGLGFEEVYQLKGGILKYLEEVPLEESLFEGECFVFDDRITVGHDLRKGVSPDHSLPSEK
jgi:UPF0176 protein